MNRENIMIQLEMKNGYYWHKASSRAEWKIVRLLQRCGTWTYFFNNEYYELKHTDILEEIPYPQ